MKSTFTILSTIFFFIAATLTIIALISAVANFTAVAMQTALTLLTCSIVSLVMIIIATYHFIKMIITQDEDAVSVVFGFSFCAISLVYIAFTLL